MDMKMKHLIIRVSEFLLDRIHDFCKREGITYSELFEQAIKKLVEKYLPEEADGQEKGPCRFEDRNDC
jgi:metal-responsive CopG/Arc/MetJ family transcriptional regulator